MEGGKGSKGWEYGSGLRPGAEKNGGWSHVGSFYVHTSARLPVLLPIEEQSNDMDKKASGHNVSCPLIAINRSRLSI